MDTQERHTACSVPGFSWKCRVFHGKETNNSEQAKRGLRARRKARERGRVTSSGWTWIGLHPKRRDESSKVRTLPLGYLAEASLTCTYARTWLYTNSPLSFPWSTQTHRRLSRGILPDHEDLALGLELRVGDGVVVEAAEGEGLLHWPELFPESKGRTDERTTVKRQKERRGTNKASGTTEQNITKKRREQIYGGGIVVCNVAKARATRQTTTTTKTATTATATSTAATAAATHKTDAQQPTTPLQKKKRERPRPPMRVGVPT